MLGPALREKHPFSARERHAKATVDSAREPAERREARNQPRESIGEGTFRVQPCAGDSRTNNKGEVQREGRGGLEGIYVYSGLCRQQGAFARFPARGYSVGDWGPHRSRLAESGEASTAGREPQWESEQRIVGLSAYVLQHVDPLATRSQCVATENATPPQIRPGARVLPGRRTSPVWAQVSDDPHLGGPCPRGWPQPFPALPHPPFPRRLKPGPLSDAEAPQCPGFGYCAKV